MSEIINVEKINSYLDCKADNSKVEAILDKAMELKGLDNDEADVGIGENIIRILLN